MNLTVGIARLTGWPLRRERAAARTTDEERRLAFEAMVAENWTRFYRYAYRLSGNAEDAEDLLSESLVEAFQAFASFRGDGFDRWVFRILTTNRIDQTRRAKVRRAESLDTSRDDGGESYEREIPDPTGDPARVLTEGMLSEEVQQALAALPENFRAPLLLCDIEEMDYADIALTLELPIGTVRSRIHRARERMRKMLALDGAQHE